MAISGLDQVPGPSHDESDFGEYQRSFRIIILIIIIIIVIIMIIVIIIVIIIFIGLEVCRQGSAVQGCRGLGFMGLL